MTHHPLIPLPFNPLPSPPSPPSPFPPFPFPPSPFPFSFPPSPCPPFPPPSVLNHPLITPSLTRYHLLLCLPLSLLFPPPSARNPRLNPSRTPPPPPPNGSNFSMVITISHINSPETHIPRFTPSLFCYLLINFPFPITSFPLLPTPPLECISIIPS